jgi:hypothetical protein
VEQSVLIILSMAGWQWMKRPDEFFDSDINPA